VLLFASTNIQRELPSVKSAPNDVCTPDKPLPQEIGVEGAGVQEETGREGFDSAVVDQPLKRTPRRNVVAEATSATIVTCASMLVNANSKDIAKTFAVLDIISKRYIYQEWDSVRRLLISQLSLS
jgi:hypothetical protein